MNFEFTEKEEAFRKEVREFIQKEVPARWWELDHGYTEETPESTLIAREFQRKMGKKGWLACRYPKEYGGIAATQWQRVVLAEEIAYSRAPVGLESEISVDWIGPSIMLFGNEAQKQKLVKGIALGELILCLGYSEPDAGSDLGGLKTTAIEKEDHFLVNGDKIWTSCAHFADYIWLLARTDPAAGYKGMSLFVVDMKLPGITVAPLINILNRHSFNQVFFDNVKVPKDSLIGQKGRGWHQVMAALTFERSGIAQVAGIRLIIDSLIKYANETKINGKPLAADPIIRDKLAQLAIQNEVAKLLSFRIVSLHEKGKGHTADRESSVSKIFQAELMANTGNLGMEILGLVGQLGQDDKWKALNGRVMRLYLYAISSSVGGGTTEVQKDIIAQRGLGLPVKG